MAVGEGISDLLLPVAGVQISTACAGIKAVGRPDLVLMALGEHSQVAAVFTKNTFAAAPVKLCKQHLQAASATRYLIINSGNANAGTGRQGDRDATATCALVAGQAEVDKTQVLPFSTGVIGELLPMEKLIAAVPALVQAPHEASWLDAGKAIMTTDTRPKAASQRVTINGQSITLTGIAKGAGMIKPDMATMLSFVATDAAIAPALLHQIVAAATDHSFHRITVDGDTSTNDANVLIATGESPLPLIDDSDSEAYQQMLMAVKAIMLSLAQQIIRDAEGATKFVEVRVGGAVTPAEARRVAFSVAESPLVKTALSASDANWGRILMAVGKAGLVDFDCSQVALKLGDINVFSAGQVAAGYTESQGAAVMAEEEICIAIELNRGDYSESVWTSDLSHKYVSINADYRT